MLKLHCRIPDVPDEDSSIDSRREWDQLRHQTGTPKRGKYHVPSASEAPSVKEHTCGGCEKIGINRCWCEQCHTMLCLQCWKVQAAHKQKVLGYRHEPTNPEVKAKLDEILILPILAKEAESHHINDKSCKWFGLINDENDETSTTFHDFGRYTELMTQSRFLEKRDQYPSLISVVGVTGMCLILNFMSSSNSPRCW